MKLTSISDVITNSSTEVFIIPNSKGHSVEEIIDITHIHAGDIFVVSEEDLEQFRKSKEDMEILGELLDIRYLDAKIPNYAFYHLMWCYIFDPRKLTPETIIDSFEVRLEYLPLEEMTDLHKDFSKDLNQNWEDLMKHYMKEIEKKSSTNYDLYMKDRIAQSCSMLSIGGLNAVKSDVSPYDVFFQEWVNKNRDRFPDIHLLNQIYQNYPSVEMAKGCIYGVFEDCDLSPSDVYDALEENGVEVYHVHV